MEAVDAVREVGDNVVDAIDESLKKRPYTTLALRRNWISVRRDLAALDTAAPMQRRQQIIEGEHGQGLAARLTLASRRESGLSPRCRGLVAILAAGALTAFVFLSSPRFIWLAARYGSADGGAHPGRRYSS